MDFFLAFKESLGGTEMYLNQSAHPFPTVFWKKAESNDSQLGTLLSSYALTPNYTPKERHLQRIKTRMSWPWIWFPLYALQHGA